MKVLKVSRKHQNHWKNYDLDGDGFITREEWAGSDAVFDALDINKDGKISPAEMASGLGAVFELAKVQFLISYQLLAIQDSKCSMVDSGFNVARPQQGAMERPRAGEHFF